MAEERYNLKNPAVKRILQEVKEMQSNPSDDFTSLPLEENIFEWQFAIRGPRDSEFEGGIYHGRIQLPAEYPFKPPSFMLLTPNGRFETQTKICLSISNHHPEHWQPSWSVRTALVALIAFMPTNPDGALGSLDYKKEERRALAIKSREAAPKFGTAERQKLIDEIHQYMLSKAPPVPQLTSAPPAEEIPSREAGEESQVNSENIEVTAGTEDPNPPDAEPVTVEDVREVRVNADAGSLHIAVQITVMEKNDTQTRSTTEEPYPIRRLQLSDKDKGYVDLLKQLTLCDSISDTDFAARFEELNSHGDDHIICVIEDNHSGKIIATGTLFIEKKFIRNCGKAGHIEDIVVDSTARGKHLGQKMIRFLSEHAKSVGCYKVILDCDEKNRGFYEKCGFEEKGVQMAMYFD